MGNRGSLRVIAQALPKEQVERKFFSNLVNYIRPRVPGGSPLVSPKIINSDAASATTSIGLASPSTSVMISAFKPNGSIISALSSVQAESASELSLVAAISAGTIQLSELDLIVSEPAQRSNEISEHDVCS